MSGLSSPAPLAQEPEARELRLVAPIRAGFPSPAADCVEEGLDLNDYLVSHPAASFLFTVRGDSMTGAGIFDGDKVVIDRSLTARHEDIVVAEVEGEYTLKRLHLLDGRVELRAEHPDYPAITLGEGETLRVWGVLTGLVRRYAR